MDKIIHAKQHAHERRPTRRRTDQQRQRLRVFQDLFSCFTPAATAHILRRCTPGVAWTGGTKGAMADAYAQRRYHVTCDEQALKDAIRQYIDERLSQEHPRGGLP
jgi:hypothetical protein